MKNRITMRSLALLLMILSVLITAVSCGTNGTSGTETTVQGQNPSQTPSDPSQNTEDLYDENGYWKDSVPADAKLSHRDVMTVYVGTNNKQYWISEEDSADIIENAVFRKNLKVEDRLDVDVELKYSQITWATRNDMYNEISNNTLNDAHKYDVITGYSVVPALLVTAGILQRVDTLKNITLDQPWWPESLQKELNIANRCYLVSGDISINSVANLYVMYFNQDMITDNQLGDIYDQVLNEKWTLEDYEEMLRYFDTIEGVASLVTNSKDCVYYSAFISACDITICELDDKGHLNMAYGSASAIDKTDRIQAMLDLDSIIMEDWTPGRNMFMSGTQAFSFIGELDYARNLNKEAEFRWGVAPLPMYNSEQESYKVWLGTGIDLFGIPKDATSAEDSALLLEVMASESYRTTMPAFYETGLKSQWAADPVTAEIFTLIRAGADYQVGAIYANNFSTNVYSLWRVPVAKNTQEWASVYESKEDMLWEDCDRIYDAIVDLPY